MAKFDASNAEILIFSFKDGMLAKLAHDLKMKVGRFTIEVDENKTIRASVDPHSIDVVCARVDGRDSASTISAGDKRRILDNLHKDVLGTKKYPDIRFVSTELSETASGYRLRGDLTLHGQTRSVAADVVREGDGLKTEVRIHQPDFGIKPFSAALGALKVKADVIVQVTTRVGI